MVKLVWDRGECKNLRHIKRDKREYGKLMEVLVSEELTSNENENIELYRSQFMTCPDFLTLL